MHIHHSDFVIIWVMHSYAETHILHGSGATERKKKSSIYSCKSPLLGLHVRHQSIHSREILHSQPTWKQRNKHAQYTYQRIQTVPNRAVTPQLFVSLSFSSLALSFPLSFLHMCDMSKSYFHVLAPLILKANTGRYVLMIVSSGHLSSVKLLSSEEVNTPIELWLF